MKRSLYFCTYLFKGKETKISNNEEALPFQTWQIVSLIAIVSPWNIEERSELQDFSEFTFSPKFEPLMETQKNRRNNFQDLWQCTENQNLPQNKNGSEIRKKIRF